MISLFARVSLVLLALVGGCGGGDEATDAATCGEAEPGERLLRRLTHAEYRQTVLDLTGVAVDGPLASDEVVDGFRNDARALVVDGLLADQYRANAEAGGAAFDGEAARCASDVDEATCAAGFVRRFGLRAFRRPLSDDDVAAYVDLWSTVAGTDGFDEGIRWVVVAMLQSPHFLYRSELGTRVSATRFALTDWELATALSYSLWGTTPDDVLLTAAAEGALSDDAGLDAQIERMRADPRAADAVGRFVEAWLDLDRLETVPREGLTPDQRASMAQATRDRVARWVEQGGTLETMFADGGLLVEPSVLTTHARPDGSSPVHRGVLVRERLLCEELPPPPPNLDTSPPPVDPTRSTRERYAQHADDRACAGCHALIDPLGFAFEHYDQLGAWRDDDAGHPIDATGHVDGVAFDGPAGLAAVLLEDERFRSCFVYTWRRHVRGTPACAADLGADVPIVEPLLDVLFTFGFRTRWGGPGEGETFARGDGAVGRFDDEPGGTPGGIRFEIGVDNDWGGGFCASGRVRNEGAEPVTWSERWPSVGVINSIWDAEAVVRGVLWIFTGRDHNATLEPGSETSFGFCAQR